MKIENQTSVVKVTRSLSPLTIALIAAVLLAAAFGLRGMMNKASNDADGRADGVDTIVR